MTEQPIFADLDYQVNKRKTRPEELLERTDSLISWQKLEGAFDPISFRASGVDGPTLCR